jgi:hypothetical protein
VTRSLRNDRDEDLATIPLVYVAVCDPRQLIVTVMAAQLGGVASEKFSISKIENGDLHVTNRSFVLGQPTGTREITCVKRR